MKEKHLRIQGFFFASLLLACTLASAQLREATGWTPKKLAHAKRYMVAAANPLAVDAGLKMLDKGGNAIDAMVATQLVLGLVEPSSSGLGGGAFLLFYAARAKAIHAYDARETAPAGVSASLFLKPDGTPMTFTEARVGGLSVGTPGTPRLLEVAHARHGKLAWRELFEPAIALAENGFRISPRFARLAARQAGLADEAPARAYFFDAGGNAKRAGSLLRNPAYAQTLRAIAAKGADAFYTGDIAKDIVEAVRSHRNAGTLSLEDLAGYRVRDVDALCGNYRAWRLCGMPPSSAGGIAVLQILGTLASFDMAQVRPGSTQAVHLFSEAGRLAYADRAKYAADDRFVDVPVKGLVDPGYIASRAPFIRPEKSMGRALPGAPPGAKHAFAEDTGDEAAGTSHLSIVDAEGNAVAMTTTIEAVYGSHVMVRGFLLNNELTDFSFAPLEAGAQVANSVAPGKRPRSAMAPFVGFDRDTGALEIVVGSPGGPQIINFVAQALVATLDWKLDMQSAIDLPHFGSRNGPTEIEKGTQLEKIQPALKAMGHEVHAIVMTSGLHGIRRTATGWEGGADPRREGVARGR